MDQALVADRLAHIQISCQIVTVFRAKWNVRAYAHRYMLTFSQAFSPRFLFLAENKIAHLIKSKIEMYRGVTISYY